VPITADNANEIVELARYGDGVFGSSLAWSPDGETLAVAGSLGVWLYDGDDLEAPPRLIDMDGRVGDLSFSPDSTLLAFASGGAVHLWNMDAQTKIATFERSSVVAFSPDGSTLATGSTIDVPGAYPPFQGVIYLWDTFTGEKLSTLKFDFKAAAFVRELAFSPDGTVLASSSSGVEWDSCTSAQTAVQFWDVSEAIGQGEVIGSAAILMVMESINFSPDGRQFASVVHFENAFYNGPLQFWDVSDYDLVESERISLDQDETAAVVVEHFVTFSPDWNMVAVSGVVRTEDALVDGVSLLNVAAGEQVEEIPAGVDFSELEFSPDGAKLSGVGKSLLETGSQSVLWLWDMEAHTQQIITQQPLELVNGYLGIFLPDDSGVLFHNHVGQLRVFDLASGTERPVVEADAGWGSVVVSRDGSTIVVRDGDKIQILDSRSGAEHSILQGNFNADDSLIVSADGHTLATAPNNDEAAAQVWDTVSGTLVATLPPYIGRGYLFSPDGSLLVISEDEATIVWDVEAGTEIAKWGNSADLLFSADGSTLLYVEIPPHGPSLFVYKYFHLWDVQSRQELTTDDYPFTDYALTHLALSPDGSRFAYSTEALTRGECDFDFTNLWDVKAQTYLRYECTPTILLLARMGRYWQLAQTMVTSNC
jgi:WD40 repeat protein